MIRRLRARLRARRFRRLTARFQQASSGGHVTVADLEHLACRGVPVGGHVLAPGEECDCPANHVHPEGPR